jgi:hypothetical protein
LRYQNIAVDRNKNFNTSNVRVLHIAAGNIAEIMQRIYSFDSKRFPLGITMRFIPHIIRMRKDKQQKVIKWRNQQQAFLHAIENPNKPMSAINWKILSLNEEFPQFGTLRQNVMGVNSKYKQNEPLFLSVDTSFFWRNEVIFTLLPRHEAEARAFATKIVPYYQHKIDIQLLIDLFHTDALKRAKQTGWDAEKEEVISPSDTYIGKSGDIQDDFDMLETMGSIQTQPIDLSSILNTKTIQVERLFTGEDSTSVGTLFTNNPNDNQGIQI